MAKILINEAQLSSIADSIREKWWIAGSMPVSSMAECVSSIMTTSEYIAIMQRIIVEHKHTITNNTFYRPTIIIDTS